MYSGARILNFVPNAQKNLGSFKVTRKSILLILMEFFTLILCTFTAFSIMGGYITDGSPNPIIVPVNYIVFSFLMIIPFGLFMVRKKIFTQ